MLQIAIELSLEVRHERRQLRGPCGSRHPFDGAELGLLICETDAHRSSEASAAAAEMPDLCLARRIDSKHVGTSIGLVEVARSGVAYRTFTSAFRSFESHQARSERDAASIPSQYTRQNRMACPRKPCFVSQLDAGAWYFHS